MEERVTPRTAADIAAHVVRLNRGVGARWTTVWLTDLVEPPVLIFATPGFLRESGWEGTVPDGVLEAWRRGAIAVRRARIVPLMGLAVPIERGGRRMGYLYCERRGWDPAEIHKVELGATDIAPGIATLLGQEQPSPAEIWRRMIPQ